MGKLTLILGGARSGKSAYAERIAAKSGGHVIYIATAQARDNEMAERITAHRAQRPDTWPTLELSQNIGHQWQAAATDADVVLLDCVTLLVSNVLLDGDPDLDKLDEVAAHEAVEKEIAALTEAIASSNAHWLIVSNEVGLGLVPSYRIGRIYRDALGRANQQLALQADAVYFMLAGLPMKLQVDDIDL